MANTYTSKFLSSSATLKSNGTVRAKPYLVSDIVPGSNSSNTVGLTNINGTLYFFTSFYLDDGSDNRAIRLWKSDGTESSTVVVKEISPVYYREPDPQELTNVNGIFYFLINSSELWKSDGTPEGTFNVVNFPGDRFRGPQLLENINSTLYFAVYNFVYDDDGNNSAKGYDLWKSDGTQQGTFLLKQFYPDNIFVNITSITSISGTLYFGVNRSEAPPALWKSDGTTIGTVPFKEFSSGGSLYQLANIKNIFYFTVESYDSNFNSTFELWKSDGTTAGTVKVKDTYALNPINFNDTLYFIAEDNTYGFELWKSDGTTAGTVLVKDINPGLSSSFDIIGSILIEVNGTLYFCANDGIHGFELWKSDGTAEGTVLVKDINPGRASSTVEYDDGRQQKNPELTNVNGILYFIADDGVHGFELWKSDGTAAGTVLVEDIYPGSTSSSISDLTNVDGTLYFNANDSINGKELWAFNANPPVVSPIVSITATNANAAEADNNPAIFRISRTGDTSTALTVKYNVDGTATNGQDYNQLTETAIIGAGKSFVDITITPVSDTFPEDSETVTLTLFDQYYQYYAVDASQNAASVSITDDLSAVVLNQPYPVKDIFPGFGSSSPSYLTNANGILYFLADDGIHGIELWKSDGTKAGTTLVKDIKPGSASSNFYNLTNANGTLYFFNYESSLNGNFVISNYNLWKSDGTTAGTVKLKSFDFNNWGISNVNDIVYFSIDDGIHGRELWKSNGTVKGTVLVKDIYPGVDEYGNNISTNIDILIDINGILYFTVYKNFNSNGLWKSDGTKAGTTLVKEINPSVFTTSVDFNGVLYFTIVGYYDTQQLWKSDGTAAGTVLVKDINPGSRSSDFSSLFKINNTLYFTAIDDTHGTELWKSDGTQAGTVLVKDINPGSSGSFDDERYSGLFLRTEVNGTLYFYANDGTHGFELWKSDGTQAGTVLVKDIKPGSGNSALNKDYYDVPASPELTNANGILYFVADDGIHGRELWKSDGTEAGTVLVKDLKPGSVGSSPSNLTSINDTLYFFADDGINGKELWAIKTDNVINGGGSRDPLTGTAGSDRIIGDTGKKTITGGAGNDEFVYTSIREVGHRITDFTVGSDKIILTQLLDSFVAGGYNGSNAIADGYVKLVQGSTSNSAILQIDRDGAVGNAVFRNFIELDNVTSQAMNNPSNFVF